jgi:cytochrome oxidase Cu insertion factor (SCO1/SenC/PrrC family)
MKHSPAGWGIALLGVCVVVVAVIAFVLVRQSKAPAATEHPAAPITAIATWKAGVRRAPGFRLVDQGGKPFSLASLRGRPVVITFIDPVCRNLCPLEAKVLAAAVRRLPMADRPVVVAVSVNPWADSTANFRQDATHWRLAAGWRWGVGSPLKLAAVWRKYGIQVEVAKKTVAGVTVRSVAHTEGSYVIDRDGYERALFLYPFNPGDVEQALRNIA